MTEDGQIPEEIVALNWEAERIEDSPVLWKLLIDEPLHIIVVEEQKVVLGVKHLTLVVIARCFSDKLRCFAVWMIRVGMGCCIVPSCDPQGLITESDLC